MSSTNIQGLETLEAWKRAKDLAVLVYKKVLPCLPVEENSNLAYQLRRSIASVPANIAEGHGRFYYQENVRFCYIARGSLIESFSHLALAQELDFIPLELQKEVRDQIEDLIRILNGYIAFLKRSKRGANEPGSNLVIREDLAAYQTDEPDEPPPGEVN
jgi:four helix bundle protein